MSVKTALGRCRLIGNPPTDRVDVDGDRGRCIDPERIGPSTKEGKHVGADVILAEHFDSLSRIGRPVGDELGEAI